MPYSTDELPRDSTVRIQLCENALISCGQNHAFNRKEYNFSVAASHAMPKLPVATEPTDWKENGITLTYADETATLTFTGNAKEWKECGGSVNTGRA